MIVGSSSRQVKDVCSMWTSVSLTLFLVALVNSDPVDICPIGAKGLGGRTIADDSNNGLYYQCVDGQALPSFCDQGKNFDSNRGACVPDTASYVNRPVNNVIAPEYEGGEPDPEVEASNSYPVFGNGPVNSPPVLTPEFGSDRGSNSYPTYNNGPVETVQPSPVQAPDQGSNSYPTYGNGPVKPVQPPPVQAPDFGGDQGSNSYPISSKGRCVGTCPTYYLDDQPAKHLPHEYDCTLFCKCDHGKPVIFVCPDGLFFNPILEVCDWPSHSRCTNYQPF